LTLVNVASFLIIFLPYVHQTQGSKIKVLLFWRRVDSLPILLDLHLYITPHSTFHVIGGCSEHSRAQVYISLVQKKRSKKICFTFHRVPKQSHGLLFAFTEAAVISQNHQDLCGRQCSHPPCHGP
jgi:hypothetical protein